MIKALKETAKKLKQEIAAIFLAYKRKDTPLIAKILAVIIVGYALSPIDLIPDFIPVIGYLDDIILLPLLITLAIKIIPKSIMEECRREAQNLWKDGKPQMKWFAWVIAAFWILVIGVVLKMFLK